jgi:hypothetical protein
MGADMLSDLQQKRVWEGLLSAEIRAYYFADLASEHHRRQRVVTWAILFLSSGAFFALVTMLVAGLPPALAWVPAGLVLLTTAMSLYAIVGQNQQRANDSADLHVRWSRLAREYEALWDNMYAEDAPARLDALADDEDALSKPGMALGRPDNRRLLKWQDYVEQRLPQRAVHASA